MQSRSCAEAARSQPVTLALAALLLLARSATATASPSCSRTPARARSAGTARRTVSSSPVHDPILLPLSLTHSPPEHRRLSARKPHRRQRPSTLSPSATSISKAHSSTSTSTLLTGPPPRQSHLSRRAVNNRLPAAPSLALSPVPIVKRHENDVPLARTPSRLGPARSTHQRRSLALASDPDMVVSQRFPTSSSHLDSSSHAEMVLSILLGLALLVALVGFVVYCLRRRKRQTSEALIGQLPIHAQSLQPPLSTSQQPPAAIPLHQPPQSPSSLSSFTRISAAAPEMSAMLSSGRVPTSRPVSASAAAISLARFFSKQAMGSSAGASGRHSVYLHRGKDLSLQKTPSATPSTRSSAYDYDWDFTSTRKERSKDGYPVITLTSPTNSETSIPMSLQDDSRMSAEYNVDPSSSTPSFANQVASSSTAAYYQGSSAHSKLFGIPRQEAQSSPPPGRSLSQLSEQGSSLSIPVRPQLQPSVPQHMLLHPTDTYNRLRQLEKQARLLSASTQPADFPPTYEEAVDGAGPSSSMSSSSAMAPPTLSVNEPISPTPVQACDATSSPKRSSPVAGSTAAASSSSTSDAPCYDEPL